MDKFKVIINDSECKEIDVDNKISKIVSQDVPYYASVKDSEEQSEIKFDYMFDKEPKVIKKEDQYIIEYGKRSGKIYKYKYNKDTDISKLIALNNELLKSIQAQQKALDSYRYAMNVKIMHTLLMSVLRLLIRENNDDKSKVRVARFLK